MTHEFPVPSFGDAPEGYELVHRYAIIRLGEGLNLYTESNHASLGITSVGLDPANPKILLVRSDFADDELCLHASAVVDATLAQKRIFAGCSGGGSETRISIYSAKDWGSTYPAGTLIAPNSRAVFNSDVDNLWVTLASLRPISLEEV